MDTITKSVGAAAAATTIANATAAISSAASSPTLSSATTNLQLCRICISSNANNCTQMISIFGEDSLWRKITTLADVQVCLPSFCWCYYCNCNLICYNCRRCRLGGYRFYSSRIVLLLFSILLTMYLVLCVIDSTKYGALLYYILTYSKWLLFSITMKN